MAMTPVDITLPGPCGCPPADPCCRTHPLILAGFLGGWVCAALLGGLLLGARLAS